MFLRWEDQIAGQFYFEITSEWDLQNPDEMIVGLGGFNEHVRGRIDGFEGVHDVYGIGKRTVEGRKLLKLCDEKKLCVANTWFEKKEQKNYIQYGWI